MLDHLGYYLVLGWVIETIGDSLYRVSSTGIDQYLSPFLSFLLDRSKQMII